MRSDHHQRAPLMLFRRAIRSSVPLRPPPISRFSLLATPTPLPISAFSFRTSPLAGSSLLATLPGASFNTVEATTPAVPATAVVVVREGVNVFPPLFRVLRSALRVRPRLAGREASGGGGEVMAVGGSAWDGGSASSAGRGRLVVD
jgi:hypothetical protein